MLRSQKKMEKRKKKEKRKMNKKPDPLIDRGQANQVILAAFQKCFQGYLFKKKKKPTENPNKFKPIEQKI